MLALAHTRRLVPLELVERAARDAGFAPSVLAAERTYDIYGNATDEQTAFWDHCVLLFELRAPCEKEHVATGPACDVSLVSALLDEWIDSAVGIAQVGNK